VLSHTCSVVNQALRCNSPSVEDLTRCNTVRGKRLADWCCAVRLQATQRTGAPLSALSQCNQYKYREPTMAANTQQKRGSEGYLLYGALGGHRLQRCQVVGL
jgi:hypothetical protein